MYKVDEKSKGGDLGHKSWPDGCGGLPKLKQGRKSKQL